jgi:mxaC protein
MSGIDFTEPRLLWLLPLALLPLWRVASLSTVVPHVAWLPRDRVGPWADIALRLLTSATIAITIVGLAGPGAPESRLAKVGRGAEIALLLDRSSSMDEEIRHNGTDITQVTRETKAQSMRKAFTSFVTRRPNDRYALILFAGSPIRVLPFTEDIEAVRSGLRAAGIGRGLTETDIGSALLAAIEAFEGRAYTGSRVIVLVSDGGAAVEPSVERRIAEGLQRLNISLYFIYIRSATNSPDLDKTSVGPIEASTPEWVLHNYFKTLPTPYRVYQARNPAAIADAVAELDRQQNLPLTYDERVPRVDWRDRAYALAAVLATILLLLRALSVRIDGAARTAARVRGVAA